MLYVFILMTIFSLTIFLYGLYIYSSKNPSLPATYHGKRNKEYIKYLGKTVMQISISPLLCGIVSLFGDGPIVIFLSGLTLIGSFIVIMYYSIKNNKYMNK